MSGVEIPEYDTAEATTGPSPTIEKVDNQFMNMVVFVIIACIIYYILSLKVTDTFISTYINGFYCNTNNLSLSLGTTEHSNVDDTLKNIVESYSNGTKNVSTKGLIIKTLMFGVAYGTILYYFGA